MSKPLASFVYPGPPNPSDSLLHSFARTGKYARRWHVEVVAVPNIAADLSIVVTTAAFYSRERIDADINRLTNSPNPFLVLQHNDHGQPTPGKYASACWTQTSVWRLLAYGAVLVRPPLLPPIFPPGEKHPPFRLATFGTIEPKKRMLDMYRRCREIGVEFTALGSPYPARQYQDYLIDLLVDGCPIRLSDQPLEKMEFMLDYTHFLFNNLGMKAATGGGALTPQQMTLFGIPICLVDDEDIYAQDGITVVPSLDALTPEVLIAARPARTDYGPDEYLDALFALAVGS